jgi:hypothetical protein
VFIVPPGSADVDGAGMGHDRSTGQQALCHVLQETGRFGGRICRRREAESGSRQVVLFRERVHSACGIFRDHGDACGPCAPASRKSTIASEPPRSKTKGQS